MYEKRARVTVAEAAIRLGVKEQAIRKRIQRGTLAHDKDEDGRVHVYLDQEDGATGTGNGIYTGMDTLVQHLQEQIAYLRQEAEDWKEEARRKDTIIMSLTQRIPELEVLWSHEQPQTRPGRARVWYLQSPRSLHSGARGCTGSSSDRSERGYATNLVLGTLQRFS